MSGSKRDRNLRVLVSEQERKMVQEIADSRGLTVADTIRLWIRERHEQLFGIEGRVQRRNEAGS